MITSLTLGQPLFQLQCSNPEVHGWGWAQNTIRYNTYAYILIYCMLLLIHAARSQRKATVLLAIRNHFPVPAHNQNKTAIIYQHIYIRLYRNSFKINVCMDTLISGMVVACERAPSQYPKCRLTGVGIPIIKTIVKDVLRPCEFYNYNPYIWKNSPYLDPSHICGCPWRLVANQREVVTDCARCYMFLNIKRNIFRKKIIVKWTIETGPWRLA